MRANDASLPGLADSDPGLPALEAVRAMQARPTRARAGRRQFAASYPQRSKVAHKNSKLARRVVAA